MERYNFENLDNSLPVTAPGQAGCLVDLVVRERNRAQNCLYIGGVDEDGYSLPDWQITITDIPWSLSASEVEELFSRFAELPFPQVVVALGTRFRPPMNDLRKWASAAARAFSPDNKKHLIGVFSAYVGRVVDVPLDHEPNDRQKGTAFYTKSDDAA